MNWQIETTHWGRWITTNEWHIESGNHLNRIYYIHSGSMELKTENGTLQLLPGYLYIFPANLSIKSDTSSANQIDHTFFDFDIIPNFLFREVISIEASKYPLLWKAFELFQELCQTYPLYSERMEESVLCAINLYLQNFLWIISRITPLSTMDDPRIIDTLRYIHEHISESLSVDHLAGRLFLNKHYFIRLFTKNTGHTPHNYIHNRRMHLAVSLLSQDLSTKEIADKCGYDNYSTFSKAFKMHYGCSPADYIQKLQHL